MLIYCPECELQISDKAITCPHCGYPLKEDVIKSTKKRRSNRRKRLPNGFGQITELKDNSLRKPFRAMVTIGKTPTGRPIAKLLKPDAYFKTYNEAYAALVEYNKNPYDLEPDITIKELYEKWISKKMKELKSESSARGITSAWCYCSELYDMRVKDVRVRHIKGCIDDGVAIFNGKKHNTTKSIKNRIKSMFNQLLDYAIELEIVDHNYSKDFTLGFNIHDANSVKKKHIVFTEREMQTLWNNCENIKYVDMILIQCYSGWRPLELISIKINNVDLDNWTFKSGVKTDAGIDRTVPIHPRIRHFVKRYYDEAISINSEYLFNSTDKNPRYTSLIFTYDKYRNIFINIIKELNMNIDHRPHDGRKHFITMAKKYKLDEYAIKYIVGHTISDITESVYTERDVSWLESEIEKIE